MRRREFIAGVGGAAAAAWPLAASAQQPAMPVIGYLSARSAESDTAMLGAFRLGLSRAGYIEGQNVTIDYRFADGYYDRLAALTTELVHKRVAVIVHAGAGETTPGDVWQQLRASQIPIVIITGADPVRLGLVTNMNRPGGTITGISTLILQLTGKNLGQLQELLSSADRIAVLLDGNRKNEALRFEIDEAAAKLGLKIRTIVVKTSSDIDTAFASPDLQKIDGIYVPISPFFLTQARQITALATRYRVPATYTRREFADAGGLMSYGYDVRNAYRLMGDYAARLLKGDKAAELPVLQPTKFELVINLKTAAALGLTVPPMLLARADEVIE